MLNRRKVTEADLRHGLIEAGIAHVDGTAQVLTGGRTNHLWRVDGAHGPLVCKVFTGDSTPLFPNDPDAEVRALQRFASLGLAPNLRGRCAVAGHAALVYGFVAGPSWADDVGAVARTLARIHATPVPDGISTADHDPHAVLALADRLIAGDATPLAQRLRALRPDGPSVCRDHPWAMLHGDPVPANIVMAHHGPVFIDWQCPAQGDPASDIAVFLSPAMQGLYGGRPLTQAMTDEFLGAYGDPDVAAHYRRRARMYHYRIAAHCLWRARRGDPGFLEAAAREIDHLDHMIGPAD